LEESDAVGPIRTIACNRQPRGTVFGDVLVPIFGMLTGTAMVLGLPLVIVYARRLWLRDSKPTRSTESERRLERMEQAIDAIAVEVERISEGQRFVTGLLAERGRERAAIPAASADRDG
jgi:hypothetical protein